MIANSARSFSNLNTRKYYWQKSLIRWITVWQDYEHLQIWPSVFRHWQLCDYVARLQFTIIMFSEICGWEEYVQFWQKCEAKKLEMLENWYKRHKMRNGARISIRNKNEVDQDHKITLLSLKIKTIIPTTKASNAATPSIVIRIILGVIFTLYTHGLPSSHSSHPSLQGMHSNSSS